jgi:hypothetical protein
MPIPTRRNSCFRSSSFSVYSLPDADALAAPNPSKPRRNARLSPHPYTPKNNRQRLFDETPDLFDETHFPYENVAKIRNFHAVEKVFHAMEKSFHAMDNFFHAMENFAKSFPWRGSSGFPEKADAESKSDGS